MKNLVNPCQFLYLITFKSIIRFIFYFKLPFFVFKVVFLSTSFYNDLHLQNLPQTLGKHWKSSTKLSRNHIRYPEQLITKACVHVSLTAVRVNSWSKPALSLSPAFSPSPLSPVGHAMLQPALLQPVVCLIGTAAITDTDCVCLLSAVCCLPLRRETEWPGRDGSVKR